jgi:hypothetical protein
MAALEGIGLRGATVTREGSHDRVRRFRALALHILKPKR